MKPALTPQQKKRLSLLKDRRNAYGERGAQSRFAIRNSKDFIERARRHDQNQQLQRSLAQPDDDQIAAIEGAVRASPKAKFKFLKMRDMPLGEMLDRKLAYRT